MNDYTVLRTESKTGLVNLTPHTVRYFGDDKIVDIPSSGVVRLLANSETDGYINVDKNNIKAKRIDNEPNVTGKSILSLNISKTKFGKPKNLPEPKEDTYYIVSALVARSCPHRKDLLITDRAKRDENGNVIGAKSFSINPFYNGDNDDEK